MLRLKSFVFMIIIGLIVAFVLGGCGKNKIVELKKEQLFKLPIGSGIEEIGVKREKNGLFVGPEDVKFVNGFFYLTDKVNQKLMKITTLGDVILVLSKGKPETDNRENQMLKTKPRKKYPFDNIGKVTVDSLNSIYIENKFLQEPKDTNEIDIFSANNKNNENNGEEKYVSYILKFDRVGNYLYKLGREGKNGNPFYYVYKIGVDEKDDLIVITADESWNKWNYYKFDNKGNLIVHKIVVSDDLLKVKNRKGRAFFIMDVLPYSYNNYLVFWISTYETLYDSKELKEEQHLWGEEIEIDKLEQKIKKEKKIKENYKRDLLYYKLVFYNLDKRKIEKTYIWENRRSNKIDTTREFIGMDQYGNGFLWKYQNVTSSIITIFKPDGTTIARRKFRFENNGIWQNINVNRDGSISAIKIDKRYVYFYRWRSDELINSYSSKKSLKEIIKEKIEAFKNANR